MDDEVLSTRRNALGENHAKVIEDMKGLALTYGVLGRHAEAKEVMGRVVQLSAPTAEEGVR